MECEAPEHCGKSEQESKTMNKFPLSELSIQELQYLKEHLEKDIKIHKDNLQYAQYSIKESIKEGLSNNPDVNDMRTWFKTKNVLRINFGIQALPLLEKQLSEVEAEIAKRG